MVATYDELRASANTKPGRGLFNLARLADLNRALDRLPDQLWEVMLVHGLLGLTQRDAAEALHISQSAVSKRFRFGIEELVFNMNGGEDGA